MSWYNVFKKQKPLNEANKKFKNVSKYKKNEYGEGFDNLSQIDGFGITSTSFNLFYNKYIDRAIDTEREKIKYYRQMACMPEIGDVIEDAVIESIQPDKEGNLLLLKIKDDNLNKNENIIKTLNEEFNDFFYSRLKATDLLWEMFKTFYEEGRYFYERIPAKNKKKGIIGLKKLPNETMDYDLDPDTGKINGFYQYLSPNAKMPNSVEEARLEDGVIGFYPSQISFVNSGNYGISKKEIFGYLEKVKTPYNQLKLLETSVIIYRIIRSPQRLVFRIDTGNMPKDKAMKYVEKIKQKFTQKESYDPDTGLIQGKSSVLSILDNYFLSQCLRLNTGIQLLSGQTKTLSELIKDHNNGIQNWTYSVDQKTGKIISGEIEWAGITRLNTDMVRVYLDNDKYIDCTPDHKFVLRDGSEVEAQNLKENTLMSKNELDKYSFDIIKVTKVEKLDFKEDTGCLTIKDPGDNHNFAVGAGVFVKNSADGRGSQIDEIGGNPSGFAELDDIHYFQRKLYKALKYPLSRVNKMMENNQSENMYMGGSVSEITRDEIKWAKFLQRTQVKICRDLLDVFMIHLDFIGLKKQYELTKDKISIELTPPNNYTEQMNQLIIENDINNYESLANNEEFPKTYLMKKYLGYTEKDFKELQEYFEIDKKYLPKDEGY